MGSSSRRAWGQAGEFGSGPGSAGAEAASGVVGPRELPLTVLRAWPENPRSIRPDRLADLKRALEADREMLAARPLIALPDGTVICGNQRLLAARELGWESLPVLTVDL